MGATHPCLLTSASAYSTDGQRFSSAGRSRRRSGRANPFRTCTLLRIAVGCHIPYSIRSTRASLFIRLLFNFSTPFQYPEADRSQLLREKGYTGLPKRPSENTLRIPVDEENVKFNIAKSQGNVNRNQDARGAILHPQEKFCCGPGNKKQFCRVVCYNGVYGITENCVAPERSGFYERQCGERCQQEHKT